MTEDPHARAWGWVAHLSEGATTPWTSYDGAGAPRDGERLPGAQQLELLRRVNAATGGKSAAAERMLRASLTGRGQPEFGLSGISDVRPGVDPSALPESELLRVAASAIADSLIVGGLPERAEARPPRRRRRHFNLVGDPWLTIPMREALRLAGHPPSGGRARTYVVGGNFDAMVVDAWSAACLDNGPAPWDAWLAKWSERDRPPARVDLVKIAGRHHPRARSVELVLDAELLPGLLGVRRPVTVPGPLAVHALEIARRVAIVLGGLVSPVERTTLLRGRLLPKLSSSAGPRLALPPAHREWSVTQGERMTASLAEAGYPVHGDWEAANARARSLGPVLDRPTETGALKVAMSLLGREAW